MELAWVAVDEGGMAVTWKKQPLLDAELPGGGARWMMAARAVWHRLVHDDVKTADDVMNFISREANEVRLRVVEP